MGRLTTAYLGLELRSPLVASASPLTGRLESARRMEECGAAAVVLPSLFEEEIIHEDSDLVLALEAGSEHFAEALSYFPNLESFPSTAEYYLALVHDAKQALRIPVIASLNATSSGGWIRYAKLIEEAGADALELNLYRVAADPTRTAADVEASELDIVSGVSKCLSIPLAVKLAPYYSSFANFAAKVTESGADGLVLMNRFYQPDLDPDSREVVPSIELSQPWELRLPLRWVAILRVSACAWHLSCHHDGRAGRDRRGQGPAGWGRRSDDDLGDPAQRARALHHRRAPAAGMDGRQRVRVGV